MTDDGGPAFPQGVLDAKRGYEQTLAAAHCGVSVRDYFAAAALQTMKLLNSWSDNPLYWEGVARSAFVCADAMLKERAK